MGSVVTRLAPSMNDRDFIAEIESQRDLMIAVATGGPRIDLRNEEYVERRARIRNALQERGLSDPHPHHSRNYAKLPRRMTGEDVC